MEPMNESMIESIVDSFIQSILRQTSSTVATATVAPISKKTSNAGRSAAADRSASAGA